MNTTPIPTSNHALVRPRGADQARHVQGVPNPEGVRPAQFLFSAAPPPQGRHTRGTDDPGRDFYAGQHVRIRNPNGSYSYGVVAYAARSYDKQVYVSVNGAKIPVVNHPHIIVPMP